MEKYIELLQKFMNCKSVSSDIGAVNKAEDLMYDYLKAAGLYCRQEIIDNRHVTYAATCEDTPDILFNSHMDIVPPSTANQMIIKKENSIIKGRGVDDCLGNAVTVARILIELQGKAKVAAFFTADEEIGGSTTLAMIHKGYCANKIAIIMDGEAYSIATAQKGIIIFKFIARGKGGHSSTPWCFDNPIDKLLDGYAKFKAAWPFSASAEEQWNNTMTPCIISAGNANNQIPDYAEMTVNVRYTSLEDQNYILDLARKSSGLEVEADRDCLPYFADESNPILIGLKDALQCEFPQEKVSFIHMNGATDARHMRSLSVPVAILGIPGGGAHSANEWADVNGMEKYVECLKKYALGEN